MDEAQIVSEAATAVIFLAAASIHLEHGWKGTLLIALAFLVAFHLGMAV